MSLGPGLTSQIGPFKTRRNDLPKVQKTAWKGGGVPGGGQAHAGHSNWYTAMNPQVFPMVFPYKSLPKPSKYTSIVSSVDNTSSRNTAPSRYRFQPMPVGMQEQHQGTQKMHIGPDKIQNLPGEEHMDQLADDKLARQEPKREIMGMMEMEKYESESDEYETPIPSRRVSGYGSVVIKKEEESNIGPSGAIEYDRHPVKLEEDIEMEYFKHSRESSYSMLPDLSFHSELNRSFDSLPRMTRADIPQIQNVMAQPLLAYGHIESTGAIGVQYESPTLSRGVSDISIDSNMSSRRSSVAITSSLAKPDLKRKDVSEHISGKKKRRITAASSTSLVEQAKAAENIKTDRIKNFINVETGQTFENVSSEMGLGAVKAMNSVAVKNKLHKKIMEKQYKEMTPKEREDHTKYLMIKARREAKSKYTANKAAKTIKRNKKGKAKIIEI